MNSKTTIYALVGLLLLAIMVIGALIYSEYNAPTTLPAQPADTVVMTEPYSAIAPDDELKLQEQIAPLIAAGDMSACEQVQNLMYKAVCINNIALNAAQETNDLSQCQYLDDVLVSRDSCERQVLSVLVLEKEDKTICALAKSTEVKLECENNFIMALAQKKQDPIICDLEADTEKARACFNNFHGQAILMSAMMGATTTSTCSDLRGETEQTQCKNTVALLASGDQEALAKVCSTEEGAATIMGLVCMLLMQGQGMMPNLPTSAQ